MPNIIILVGPAGSGKTTLANNLIDNDGDHGSATIYVNQDSQGKNHLVVFKEAIENKKDIIVDRMDFNKDQRRRYLEPAKAAGYTSKIIVLHENRATCLERMKNRLNHPTIKTEESANSALNTFFSKYERPTEDEADEVHFRYPELINPPTTVVIDIDNTLSSSNHRQHHLSRENGRKPHWHGFFSEMHLDPVNEWCKHICNNLRHNTIITLCSGRPDSYREVTKKWLEDNKVMYDHLFMRMRQDSRDDTIVKQNLIDFEVLTRYKFLFAIDDRKRIIDKYRERGITVLDCAGEAGNF